MITFPIDRTPFHTQKYTSTQATNKLMASGTLREPGSSIPLETFRTSFLINVKKINTVYSVGIRKGPLLKEKLVKCDWKMKWRNDSDTCWRIWAIVSSVNLKNGETGQICLGDCKSPRPSSERFEDKQLKQLTPGTLRLKRYQSRLYLKRCTRNNLLCSTDDDSPTKECPS